MNFGRNRGVRTCNVCVGVCVLEAGRKSPRWCRIHCQSVYGQRWRKRGRLNVERSETDTMTVCGCVGCRIRKVDTIFYGYGADV